MKNGPINGSGGGNPVARDEETVAVALSRFSIVCERAGHNMPDMEKKIKNRKKLYNKKITTRVMYLYLYTSCSAPATPLLPDTVREFTHSLL